MKMTKPFIYKTNIADISDWIFSTTAICIYVGILLIAIVILVVYLMATDKRRAHVNSSGPRTYASIPNSQENNTDANIPSRFGSSRFEELTRIDEAAAKYVTPNFDNSLSLEEIADRFRNYAALGDPATNTPKLYYSKEDICRFIGGLAVSKIMILQGMSGTGKTSLAISFGKFINNYAQIIPVQPMWKERTDLLGYFNEFTNKFNETDLLKKLYEANTNNDIYILVLDEMNIARIEYYFAEFLSALEIPDYDKRVLPVVSSGWENDPKKIVDGQLTIPTNMWFIGTANNDDSTFAISDKVYDRAMVLNLDKRATPFEPKKVEGIKLSEDRFNELIKKAQKEYRLSTRNYQRIRELDSYMTKIYHITFGNRIMKQIREYVPVYIACGGKELEAIDDILSKKLMRKLESQAPIFIKNTAGELKHFIDDLFGVDAMPLCKEYIDIICNNR